MAEALDPQVVLFAPVKGVRIEDDGTVTPVEHELRLLLDYHIVLVALPFLVADA